MPRQPNLKRKAAAASSDEEAEYNQQSGSESPDEPIQTARRTGKKAKKSKEITDDESEEQDLRTTAKKSKATKPASIKKPRVGQSTDSNDDVKAGVNELGEKYVDLGKKRRATVRQFKGATFLDIREFYGDEDDLKPGKKGISLAKEQWEALKRSSETIDAFFAKLGK